MVILLLIHYVATLIMTGAIWLAQLSQYPLLAYIGRRNFVRYEHEHIKRISNIAWFVIYIELFTGAALFILPPLSTTNTTPLFGLILIMIIWATTWFIQYPIHLKLEEGFDKQLHRRLVQSNWIRTIAWTVRAILWTVFLGGLVS